MHDTTIKMKNGQEFCGPIYQYRPQEGWVSLFGYGERFFFRDMESAVTENSRDRIDEEAKDRDELARAKRNGWDGK